MVIILQNLACNFTKIDNFKSILLKKQKYVALIHGHSVYNYFQLGKKMI